MKPARLALVAATALALPGAIPPAAGAQTPASDCAPAPADYTGADQTLDELRDQRIDAAANCRALADRLDAIAASSGTTSDAAGVLRDLATGTGIATTAPADAPPAGTQTVTLTDADKTWWADSLTGVRADVWFGIGAVMALFLGYFLIRRGDA